MFLIIIHLVYKSAIYITRMSKFIQYTVVVRFNDIIEVPILISRYTVMGVRRMYEISLERFINSSHDITWLRRAIFRLRDNEYHEANGTDPLIPYPTLYEREDALLGLVFVPE